MSSLWVNGKPSLLVLLVNIQFVVVVVEFFDVSTTTILLVNQKKCV